jgi:3-oxoacyl-[acyl-carrier-protein] synthase-3
MGEDFENKNQETVVGLRGVGAVLPPRSLDLDQLASQGLLVSTPETLNQFGFCQAYLADHDHDAGWLALQAARAALDDAGLQADQIDLVIWASALADNHLRVDPEDRAGTGRQAVLKEFRYASGWLQEELGLHQAQVLAVAQQGCVSMFSALRLARSLLVAEPGLRHALCVGVDVLPSAAPREILFNLISDAACAVVVSRGCPRDRWAGYHQISRGYYWDPLARQPEILASYFPTSRLVIQELLRQQGLGPADIDLVVPTGVSRPSWDILLRLVGIPAERLYQGVDSFGHTIMADSFLFLQDLRRRGKAPAGSRLLLFSYGFGSSWCGLLLEH